MVRVCVVGGGRAGLAAAREAALSGGEVTLYDKRTHLTGPPSFDPRHHTGIPLGEVLEGLQVEVKLGESVVAVDQRRRVATTFSSQRFDAVVIATGATAQAPTIRGARKAGVFIVDSREALRQVEDSPFDGGVVISGSGSEALFVAEALRKKVRSPVLVADRRWAADLQVPESGSILECAAMRSGTRLLYGGITQILGERRVEAVSVDGLVVPCTTLVVVPRFVPSSPSVPVARSTGGAITVDNRLGSSVEGIFAAGGCASWPLSVPMTSFYGDVIASASGRVAGANAAGRFAKLTVPLTFDEEVFGVRFLCVGLPYDVAVHEGYNVGVAQVAGEALSRCWVVFRRSDSRVLGVQLALEHPGPTVDLSLAVSRGISLNDLAYGALSASTDISLVSEAAREALRNG